MNYIIHVIYISYIIYRSFSQPSKYIYYLGITGRASKEYGGSIISAIALLSSGLDSVTSLAIAQEETDIRLALIFDYGQKAAAREIEYSQKVAEKYGIEHRLIPLTWLKDITTTSLVSKEMAVPHISMQDIADESDPAITQDSAKKVWVPNRNGVMINIAASFAESLGCKYVIVGFNSEEAVTFPDNSTAYLNSLDKCLGYSTLNGVKMMAPVAGIDNMFVQVNTPSNKKKGDCSRFAIAPCPIAPIALIILATKFNMYIASNTQESVFDQNDIFWSLASLWYGSIFNSSSFSSTS